MTAATFAKIGLIAAAALVAKGAYSAMCARDSGVKGGNKVNANSPQRYTSAGLPADAFSHNAVEHDLSIGDAI